MLLPIIFRCRRRFHDFHAAAIVTPPIIAIFTPLADASFDGYATLPFL
jgi:hypothetical protein